MSPLEVSVGNGRTVGLEGGFVADLAYHGPKPFEWRKAVCGTVVEAGHCDHGKDRSCREGKAAIVIKFPLLAYFGSIKYTSPIELFLIGKRERHLEH
jgi:hypothetical protein